MTPSVLSESSDLYDGALLMHGNNKKNASDTAASLKLNGAAKVSNKLEFN